MRPVPVNVCSICTLCIHLVLLGSIALASRQSWMHHPNRNNYNNYRISSSNLGGYRGHHNGWRPSNKLGLYMREPSNKYSFDDSNNYLHEFFATNEHHQQHQMGRHHQMAGSVTDSLNHDSVQPFQQTFQGAVIRESTGFQQLQQSEPDYSGMEGFSEDKPIKAAVYSHHEHKVYNVPDEFHYYEPTVVHLEGKIYPLELHWNSYSSPMITKHNHYPGEHHHEDTYSRDKPHTHIHTISKPIYHEVREVITPHKNWYRVIRPLREKVQTYIHQRAKEDPMQHYHRFHGRADERSSSHEHHQHQHEHR